MVMRIGGLASGMDIDALVEKLMTAERAPVDKLEQKKTTYEWQRDAYREVNTKLKTFDTYIADNLVLKTLNSKTASSSNSSLVSATATGKATGSLSIEGVSQLATSATAVGVQKSITSNMTLGNIMGSGNVPTKIQLGSIDTQGNLSTPVELELTENMTVDQFVNKVNSSNTGLTAVFENGTFSLTANNSGRVASGQSAINMDDAAKNVFSQFGIDDSRITEGQNARFVVNGIATERSSNTFSLNGYNVTLNSTFNEQNTHIKFAGVAVGELNTRTEQLNSTLDTLAQKYGTTFSATTGTSAQTIEDLKYQELSTNLATVLSSKQSEVNAKEVNLQAAKNIKVKGTDAAETFLSSLTTDEQKSRFETQTTKLTEDQLNELGLTEDQKAAYNNLSETDRTSLTNNAGKVYDSLSNEAKALLTTLSTSLNDPSLSAEDKQKLENLTEDELNAVKAVHSETNSLASSREEMANVTADINELNDKYTQYESTVATVLTAGSTPTNTVVAQNVTLTSTSNVDDMMTKIKDFVTTYNGLIKGLNDQTKEAKYRDYAPLTAAQKKEMDEDEIKLWEEKAKSGLLKNDSLIRNGLSNMRSLIYQSNPAVEDSRFNTLFSIGITTSSSYNDGGTLQIDEAKLRKALEENPDAVEQLFKNADGKKDDLINGETVDTRGYLEKLRESMKSLEINIEKKAGRSTMTDAQYSLGKMLTDTTKRLDSWEDKLKTIEERYWKQFTAMETAINKANQQSSMFMQG